MENPRGGSQWKMTRRSRGFAVALSGKSIGGHGVENRSVAMEVFDRRRLGFEMKGFRSAATGFRDEGFSIGGDWV
ncbi:hypothetical protein U1Q18_005520 [Sarracenia purpurea var. burkii]